MVRPWASTQSNEPPLLATYSLPSGPTAAPLGPPPVRATTSTEPSGPTRVTVPRLISTTTTLPSLMATGPSGNWSPEAISCRLTILPPSRSRVARRGSIPAQPGGEGGQVAGASHLGHAQTSTRGSSRDHTSAGRPGRQS